VPRVVRQLDERRSGQRGDGRRVGGDLEPHRDPGVGAGSHQPGPGCLGEGHRADRDGDGAGSGGRSDPQLAAPGAPVRGAAQWREGDRLRPVDRDLCAVAAAGCGRRRPPRPDARSSPTAAGTAREDRLRRAARRATASDGPSSCRRGRPPWPSRSPGRRRRPGSCRSGRLARRGHRLSVDPRSYRRAHMIGKFDHVRSPPLSLARKPRCAGRDRGDNFAAHPILRH
jgi:hypothetical protein